MTTEQTVEVEQAQEALAAEVERFLRDRLPASWLAALEQGDSEAIAAERERLDLKRWWTDLADAGYVTPTWPKEYGGLGISARLAAAVMRTMARYKVPWPRNPIGIDLAGPAIITWGTDEQREQLLRPIGRHDDIWCQLFSEPGAGSDLAGLATRAVRDGDEWILNGQKVWTSLGDLASWGLLLARTDPDVPKHKGITAFLLPMHQDGVTVRPLRQATGDSEFCEVFLDDARVHDSLRLGEVNDGWRVALSVLLHERSALADNPSTAIGRTVGALIARHAPVANPALQERLTQAYIDDKLITLTKQRAAAKRRAGFTPGPEGSISKLYFSEYTQRMHDLAVDLEGPAGQAWLDDDRWRTGTAWSLVRVRARTIAGGSSEIQRNILGERVLGLPKEPDVDRAIPWSQVRRS
jgi:alkylation response protein AidB-like acyl-CoA dehydrogenase